MGKEKSMMGDGMERIADLLAKMKFKKKIIGGVDEQDVWRRLDELQKEYRKAYEAQRIRYETLLLVHGITVPDEDDVFAVSETGKSPTKKDEASTKGER